MVPGPVEKIKGQQCNHFAPKLSVQPLHGFSSFCAAENAIVWLFVSPEPFQDCRRSNVLLITELHELAHTEFPPVSVPDRSSYQFRVKPEDLIEYYFESGWWHG